MPLYHTMGVRSLLAMSLVGGTFVCVPQFDAARALALITAERISNLYLVPTLYHDLVHHPAFAGADVRSVRKLGFAGAPMTERSCKSSKLRSGRICSSIITAAPRSTPSPSTRTPPKSPARPAAPE